MFGKGGGFSFSTSAGVRSALVTLTGGETSQTFEVMAARWRGWRACRHWEANVFRLILNRLKRHYVSKGVSLLGSVSPGVMLALQTAAPLSCCRALLARPVFLQPFTSPVFLRARFESGPTAIGALHLPCTDVTSSVSHHNRKEREGKAALVRIVSSGYSSTIF